MKSRLKKSAVLLIAFLLQYSVVPKLTVFSFSANLCVLALVAVCYFSSPAEAAAFGAALGLVMDGGNGRCFGVQLLLCMYLAAAVKLLASEKINNSPAIMALYMWLFTFVYYIAYGLFSTVVLSGSVSPGRWLITAAVTATINMILSLPLLWAAERLTRRGANE
ncbi:MAG: rod shape-determining protein MreD [Clostridia bacterium]